MDTTTTGQLFQPKQQGDFYSQRPPIVLSPTQQEAHDLLLNYLTGNTQYPAAVFSGYAGTGKSTTIGVLVNSIRQTIGRKVIAVSAPTHKAVKVLKRDALPEVEYRTIHSLLGLKEQINHVTGQITYAPDTFLKEDPPIADVQILIIDEVSMLGKDLFEYLVPWMKQGLKVVFTGDQAQIPPVKEKDSIPFLHGKEWGMLCVGLTEIMRQKMGNPILEFATHIRNNPTTTTLTPQQSVNEVGEGIVLVDHGSMEERQLLQEYFDCPEFKSNPDYMKVIAWQNKTVDKYNEMIRRIIYKDLTHLPDIVVGEKLLMDKPYILTGRSIVATNEEVEVLDVVTAYRTYQYFDSHAVPVTQKVTVYSTTVKYFTLNSEKVATFDILHESSKTEFNNFIQKLKQEAMDAPGPMKGSMWRQYYGVMDKLAWVKYNYAITAHKSQGSSYDHCLVLKWDIEVNKRNIIERNRILYVACTRARHTLFIES